MIFSKKTAAEKRQALRDTFAAGTLMQIPGAFSPLCALAVEDAGFEGVYVSGAVVSADMALPDIGLFGLTEVAYRAEQIARVTDLPTLCDVDTGFGEPMSAARTVRMMEERGVSAIHLEDQVNPKRCGHLDGKAVVDTDDMVRRVKAAVSARRDPNFVIMARSDARALEGLDAMIDRIKAYVDAGADAIFPEALQNEQEFEAVRKAVTVPLLANMTEFGKSKLLDAKTLSDLGYNIALYPVTTLRLAMKAAIDGLKVIRETGSQESILDQMQHRRDLYALLRYEDYNSFDQSLFNFKVVD